MAGLKITEATNKEELEGNEEFPINFEADDFKVTLNTIADWLEEYKLQRRIFKDSTLTEDEIMLLNGSDVNNRGLYFAIDTKEVLKVKEFETNQWYMTVLDQKNRIINYENTDYVQYRRPDNTTFIKNIRTNLNNNTGAWIERETLIYT